MSTYASHKKKCILIVEDEPDFSEMLIDVFARLDIKALTSEKYVDAKHKIKNQKFDLIFVDMRIGSESGEDIIEHVRQDPQGFNKDTPIIVMSGFLDAKLVERISDKVNDILVKPFDLKAMQERTLAVLNAPLKSMKDRKKN